MANLMFKTKGMVNPKGKPRVYFTCHPADFERCFNKICKDIFKTHDCAIFYTEDMTEPFENQNLDTDLGSMNLFVIPVTFKLLTTPNRAMNFDFSYAQKNHIPILPIMLESGIDDLYSHPDKFGELQYINPYSTDLTEISYTEKLKKHLESVLISNEMAKRVRAAFDAYIFLSYRKKDRRYANELMRIIHAKPDFRDVAIWYDEFLTPGESFNENIAKILKNSKLFTLLVTPSLLEEPGGKPNFVMGKEYPLAKNIGMDIIPAEMEDTDKNELKLKFNGIPDCVNPYDEAFKERLLKSITKIAITENDDNPEHNFLVGLAYLDGIDVEVNYNRALKLIRLAAEHNLIEACEKLVALYSDRKRTDYDILEAISWQKKYCDLLKQKYLANNDEQDCLNYLKAELSLARHQLDGEILKDSRNTCWRVIKLCRENGGYGGFINNGRIGVYVEAYAILGSMFYARGDFGQTRECYEKAIRIYNDYIESIERSPHFLSIIGSCYYQLSELFSKRPFEDEKNKYKCLEKAIGLLIDSQEGFFGSLESCNLGNCYMNLGKLYEKDNFLKAIEAYDKAREIFERILETDSGSEISLNIYRLNICYGDAYKYNSSYIKAMDYYDKAIDICWSFLKNTDALEMNYNFCVGCLRIIDLMDISSEKSSHENIEDSVLSIAEWLIENNSIAKYQELLADAYLSCKKKTAQYGVKAFEIYRGLAQQYPEIYGSKFWQCKRELWKQNILNKTHFPFVRLMAKYDENGNLLYFTSECGNNVYHFDVRFISKGRSFGTVEEIIICQYALWDMQDKYSYTYKVESAFKTLQLCEPGAIGTRQDPTPDEFVYVSFHGRISRRFKFQKCYG